MAMRGALLHHQRSLLGFLSSETRCSLFYHHIHTDGGNSDSRSDNSFESADDFDRRIFGSLDDGPNTGSFYRKLDKLEKAHGRSNIGSRMNEDGGSSDSRRDNSFESADDFERRMFGSLDDGPNTGSFYRKLDKIEKAHGRSNIGSRMNDGDGGSSNSRRDNSFESSDDFDRRIFGFLDDGPNSGSFYRKLDKLEKAHGGSNIGSRMNDGGNSRILDGLGRSFDTSSDGMDEKLEKAARTFSYTDEINNEDYSFRPDVTFKPQTTYTTRDLDLTKPGIQRNPKRAGFQTNTKEVLKKADFRNVRFLSNFLTEAGIIIKRSQTKISAKAQRKVAREIKTARAFGLMPFTTMGTKQFIFGKTMKDEDADYDYYDYNVYSGGMPSATAAEPYQEI